MIDFLSQPAHLNFLIAVAACSRDHLEKLELEASALAPPAAIRVNSLLDPFETLVEPTEPFLRPVKSARFGPVWSGRAEVFARDIG